MQVVLRPKFVYLFIFHLTNPFIEVEEFQPQFLAFKVSKELTKDEYRKRLEQCKDEFSKLQVENKHLKEKIIRKLEAENSMLIKKNNDLEIKVGQMQKEFEELQNKIDQLEKTIQELETYKSKISEEYQKKLAHQENVIKKLEKQYKCLENKVKQLEDEIETLKEESETLKVQNQLLLTVGRLVKIEERRNAVLQIGDLVSLLSFYYCPKWRSFCTEYCNAQEEYNCTVYDVYTNKEMYSADDLQVAKQQHENKVKDICSRFMQRKFILQFHHFCN